ncbi:pilus assembly FimT family protein [Dyella lutea]|uniref:Type II secretion system protein H n=1 Tax=Dyella lutea TaxID=2950441 RepID=A0ABT1FEF5_9GAMM|nr:GspH/FimT family pseudopilin [Dyella lutea]MCP1375500.1 GspH/FimT family pseudopilin [Dyella lutea]
MMHGFTMVELMITVAVAAILLAIAVPSFHTITLSSRLSTASNDVIAAFNTARLEAIKLNARTQLCSDSASSNSSSTLGSACGTQAGAVYALNGSSAVLVRAASLNVTSPLKLNGGMAALQFNGEGLATVVGSTTPAQVTIADICTSDLSSDNHRVVTITAGYSIQTQKQTGDCP